MLVLTFTLSLQFSYLTKLLLQIKKNKFKDLSLHVQVVLGYVRKALFSSCPCGLGSQGRVMQYLSISLLYKRKILVKVQ